MDGSTDGDFSLFVIGTSLLIRHSGFLIRHFSCRVGLWPTRFFVIPAEAGIQFFCIQFFFDSMFNSSPALHFSPCGGLSPATILQFAKTIQSFAMP